MCDLKLNIMKKENKVLFVILMIAVIISFGFNKSFSQVTDIDGNVYKTVKIGNQEWMAENLIVEHYRNGDPILTLKEKYESSTSTSDTGAWCYYDNDSKNENPYGRLYEWYVVNDTRGLAPEGWHIPSDAEWTELIAFLGGEKVAGSKLKATILWQNPNKGATNESGFSAIPGGFLTYRLQFLSKGQSCLFWSSTKSKNYELHAWSIDLDYDKSVVNRNESFKTEGQSVRCVKD